MVPALLLYALAAGILLVTAITIRLVSRSDAFTPVTEMDAPPAAEGDAGPWVSVQLAEPLDAPEIVRGSDSGSADPGAGT